MTEPIEGTTALSDPNAQSFYVVGDVGLTPGEIKSVLTGQPVEPDALTAASNESKYDGGMIALIPSEYDVERLALDGYEEPDELHLTLFFLGDDEVPENERDAIIASMDSFAGSSIISGNAFGVANWNVESDQPSWVLNVGNSAVGTSLEVIRENVRMKLDAIGFVLPEQYTPWAPHICLAYTEDDVSSEMRDRVGPIIFDRMRIAFGHDVIDVDLGYAPTVVAAGKKPQNHDQLKDYWTKDPRGLAKWVDHAHPWTELYSHLKKHMPDEMAKRVASKWYHEVKGHWPNEDKKGGKGGKK